MTCQNDLDLRILHQIGKGALAPIDENFEKLALDLFDYQFSSIQMYRSFCEKRNARPSTIKHFSQIPLFPTSAFRYDRMATFPEKECIATFLSSGTTTQQRSAHYYDTLELYEKASLISFRDLVSNKENFFSLLSLIPPYREKLNSSLAYMLEAFSKHFFFSQIGHAFHRDSVDVEYATHFALQACQKKHPLLIASTTVALSDWLCHLKRMDLHLNLPKGSLLFETGGRKGRRYVPSTEELAKEAEIFLQLPHENYLGEYGMTELSSPSWGFYVNGHLMYRSPSWCPVRILDPANYKDVPVGEEGMVSFFDLANRGSVSSLFTGDWARKHEKGFEILGRIKDSEIRGCSLQVSPPSFFLHEHHSYDFSMVKQEVKDAPFVSLEQTINSLSELTQNWLNPKFAPRLAVEESIAQSSFFSPGSIVAGVDKTFKALTFHELKLAVNKVWPTGVRPEPTGLAIHIHAGNIPVTGVFGFYASLLAGAPSIHRVSQRGGELVSNLYQTLQKIDLRLAQKTAVITTPSHQDEVTKRLFQETDLIVAQGDDATLTRLASISPSNSRFVSYKSRFSFALFMESEPIKRDLLKLLLQDIYIWEQQGCLSPQVVVFVGVDSKKILKDMETLLDVASEQAKKWNRNPLKRTEAQILWQSFDEGFQMKGQDPFFHSPQLTLFLTRKIHLSWMATPGFIQMILLKDVEELVKMLEPWRGRICSMAIDPDQIHSNVVKRLASDGLVERITSFGMLQAPSFSWDQDSHNRLQIYRKN